MYIYYIYRDNKGMYIGQDSNNTADYTRIRAHILNAYTTTKQWGSESLIKENSARLMNYDIYDEQQDYGISLETYNEFLKYWTPKSSNGNGNVKLNLAEIFHILYYNRERNVNLRNAQIGGYHMTFVLNWAAFANSVGQNAQGYIQTIETLRRQWNGTKTSEIVIDPFNPKDTFNKLFNPFKYRIYELGLERLGQDLIIDDDFQQKILVPWIISEMNGTKINPTTRIKNYIKDSPTFRAINQAILAAGGNLTINVEEVDWTSVANSIRKQIEARLKKLITVRNAIEAGSIEEVIQRIVYLMKPFGKEITDDPIHIKIKAIETKNIKIEDKDVPLWYKMLCQDLNSAKPSEYLLYGKGSAALKSAIKHTSYTAFVKNVNAVKIEGIIPDYTTTKEETLRWKVREQYKAMGVKGNLLHDWDIFYRQMVTIYERQERSDKLIEINKWHDYIITVNNYLQSVTGKTPEELWDDEIVYSFLTSTWDWIQAYQEYGVDDLLLY